MDYDSQFLSNPEIKSTLLTIYDKIGMSPTREVGYELFIDLILNNIYSSSIISFIITQVGDFITSLNPKEKEPYLKLLSLIFFNPNNQEDEEETNGNPQINKNIYYIYLSPVLNIIQTIINEPHSHLFPTISNIYAEIVQYVMPTDISASTRKLNIDKDEQLRRFKERESTPSKQWKITDEDWRNREKWDEYEKAVDRMIRLTSTKNAPWTVIEGNDKKYARIKALDTICKMIEKRISKD